MLRRHAAQVARAREVAHGGTAALRHLQQRAAALGRRRRDGGERGVRELQPLRLGVGRALEGVEDVHGRLERAALHCRRKVHLRAALKTSNMNLIHMAAGAHHTQAPHGLSPYVLPCILHLLALIFTRTRGRTRLSLSR